MPYAWSENTRVAVDIRNAAPRQFCYKRSMLYSLYEAQHLALVPLRYMAELSRGWFGNPFSPFAHLPLSRRLAASSDLFLRVTGRYEKPAWNLGEYSLPRAKPFCMLLHFPKTGAKPNALVLSRILRRDSSL